MHKNTTLNLTGIIFKVVSLKNSANLLTFSLKGLHHELTLAVSFYFLFFVRSHVPIYNSKYPCLDIRCLNSSCTTSNPATSAQFHTGILVQLVAVNANFCQSLMLRCSYTKDRKGAWSYSVCVIVTSLWICSITVFHHHRLFTLSRDDSSEYRVCPTSGPFVLEQWD